MTQSRKKLKLTLRHFYAAAKYAGILLIAINYPRLPGTVAPWPGWRLPRCAMMLWVVPLLLIGFRTDLAAGRAILRDREELQQGKAGGGLNLSTLLALTTPLFFLIDAAAVAHFYTAWFSGTPAPYTTRVMGHMAIMAAGCVLWIYGRVMPSLPFNSVWGFRVAAMTKDPRAWRLWHAKAAGVVYIVALVLLVVGTFLPAQ